MASPVRFYIESEPTGNMRVRRGWFGKMILQIEVHVDSRCGFNTEHHVTTRWRDATEKDVGIKFAPLNIPSI